MKQTLLFAALGLVAAGAGAQEVGRVLSSTPVIQQVAVPRTYCNQPTYVAPPPTSGAGGVMGAIAGGAIGSEADRKRCESWWASRGTHYQHGGYYQGGGYPPPPPYYGGHGGTTVYQQGGYGYYGYGAPYGYYTPGVVVTTVITNGAPVVTERVETSTRTYYETVPVKKKRYVAKKKWKPKPKPRCVC